jgi:DHA2 family multidrug resistance protein
MGAGIGLIFIPLTTLTMSVIPKEKMGNGTAIFNLLRNIGGSVGVAFSTTLLARREQLHRQQLVADLTPFSRPYREALARIGALLSGVSGEALAGRELARQAAMLSFNDVFLLLAVLMVLISPLTFLMQRPDDEAPAMLAH